MSMLASLVELRRNIWVMACAGAGVYRLATKYMRIIYLL